MAKILYMYVGTTLNENCSRSNQCNNTGVIAILSTLLVILLIGLTVSVTVNVWLRLKNTRLLYNTI